MVNFRAPSLHHKVKARKRKNSLGERHQGALGVWGRRNITAVTRHNNDDGDGDDDDNNNNNNNNSNLLRLHLQYLSALLCRNWFLLLTTVKYKDCYVLRCNAVHLMKREKPTRCNN